MQDDFGQKGGKVKLVEMGEIGSCFGEDLFPDLCKEIEERGGWNAYDLSENIRKALVTLCRDKLPERGFTIEATKGEIFGLEFNPFVCEVTLVPKADVPQKWTKEDDEMLKTALWHCSNSISNGKSHDEKCDTTEWLRGIKRRIQDNPTTLGQILVNILDNHVGRDGAGNRIALFGEDLISTIEEALEVPRRGLWPKKSQ